MRSRDKAVAPTVEASSVASIKPGTSGNLVLVIDDEETVRNFMRRSLAREGFGVGGIQGLKLARELEHTLITLDVLMSGLDGWSVLREIRADPKRARIPVAILTILDQRNRGLVRRAMTI
jgi:DNA-binding response OmpR family regulator